MRNGNHNGKISVHAIAGNHVVTLGFDATDEAMAGLLGFAIHRTEFDEQGNVREAYFLRGYKPFKEVYQQPQPGVFYSTFEHPIQSFVWGDYSVSPGTKYRYKIIPLYGQPKNLVYGDAVEVEITTERCEGDEHEIYFNRGVAASQAYTLKFGGKKPDKLSNLDPLDANNEFVGNKGDAYEWLSRGLFEGIRDFIRQAKDHTFQLRVALYELDYPPILRELKLAQGRGVDVGIIYHAKNAEEAQVVANKRDLFNAGFTLDNQQTTFAREKSGGIFHHKFFILLKDNVPIRVFSGSTNISEGGIYGHSNVGHCVKNPAIAEKFMRLWELLKTDPARSELIEQIAAFQENIDPENIPPGVSVIFSPESTDERLETYIKVMGNAKRLANITISFTIDKRIFAELERKSDAVRYVMLNTDKEADKKDRETGVVIEEGMDYVQHFRYDGDVFIAPGGSVEKDWEQWMKETLTGFNGNSVRYIHNKFLLVDALTDDPIVITGSANFSSASIAKNDENMLIIRGNKRVADIYLGEFFRIYDHLYFRYILTKFVTDDVEGGFLKSKSEDWIRSYQNPRSNRFKKRKIFSFGFN